MKRLLLILPLAACGPHIDPCLRPCNPLIEECRCVKMDHSDHTAVVDHAPDTGVDGDDHNGGSSDANGDVSSGDSNGSSDGSNSSDENGGKS